MNKKFYKTCKDRAKQLQKEYDHSRKKIYADYMREFTILEGFIDFSINLGLSLDSYIPQIEKPALQFALLRIQERSIKIFREGKILLENGSASGAMARWRTLFEFSVVAKMLVKFPDLAVKYIDYAKIDDYKCARKLMEYREQLNLLDYNMDDFFDIKAEYEKTMEKYGWIGKDYEWAKNEYVKNPNLFNLSKIVGLEHLYAYVDEAHKYNHPCMRYLLNDRGSKASEDDLQTYLFSPFGIELPIQLVAISLHEINQAVITGYMQLSSADKDELALYLNRNEDFPSAVLELIKKRIKSEAPQ